jgi:hypothetical protein
MAGTEVFLITYLLQLIKFTPLLKYPVLPTISHGLFMNERGGKG